MSGKENETEASDSLSAPFSPGPVAVNGLGELPSPNVSAPARVIGALFTGWLVPGSGHALLGKKGRGLLFFALVTASFVLGSMLAGRLPWSFEGSPLTTLASLGSAGSGLLFVIGRFILGYEGVPEAPGYEYGSAFVLTAGLMNILLLLDIWDVGTGKKP